MATLISSEFLINSTTDFVETVPQVAIDGQGNFVVVWASENLANLLEQSIFFRRFDATANDVDDADVVVKTTTQNDRLSDPTVAMADDGRFVVVWEDDADVGDGTELRIAAQLYEADGDADGTVFSITSDLTSSNFSPDIAINRTTGDFVVTWIEVDEDDGDRSILARRFDSDGEALDDEDIVVETIDADEITAGESLDAPAIAIDSSGNYTITWVQNLNSTNNDEGLDIYARLYDSSSNPLTNSFVVNNEQDESQFSPDIAADADGNFTIVWQSATIDDINRDPGIFARRFNNSGAALDIEFTVSAPEITDRIETNPAIGIDNLGNTLITWTSLEIGGNTGLDIFAQQYDPNGATVGSIFQVNADEQEDGSQTRSAVAVDPDGDAVVVFQGDLQNSTALAGDQDIFGQRVDLIDDPSSTTPPSVPGDGDTSNGTNDDDVLTGDSANNTINGRGGSDTIRGRGGSDTLNGGAGADTISGNNGSDTIQGGNGNDRINGGGGIDNISGDGGRDVIRGGGGNDFIRGGNGRDRIIGGNGDDRLNGGGGSDELIGNAGVNILNGGGGQNLLIGSDNGNDTFVLLEDNGFATIENFRSGEDRLGFTNVSTALNANYTYNGSGTLVTINGQQVGFIQDFNFFESPDRRGIFVVVTQEEIDATSAA